MNYFEQLEALDALQGGYFYPWTSAVGDGNGEDAYTRLVEAHLAPGATVLEAGCGHGPDLLAFAPKVGRYIAYDAVERFVARAQSAAAAAGLANVEVMTHNSSAKFNEGVVRVPADDQSLDLIISRRGPSNWIADARRACRPGARLIEVNPLLGPIPAWNAGLPEALRITSNPANPLPADIPGEIQALLDAAGIVLHSGWTFDVPEVISDPDALYAYLTFMRFEADLPGRDEARPALAGVLARHGGGLDIRQRRYLWMAVV